MVFNFFGIACVRITIAGAIMDINGHHYIFSFFRLSVFLRVITYLYVIFPVRDSVTRIMVDRHMRFIVKLNNRLRMNIRVTNYLCRSIRAVV